MARHIDFSQWGTGPAKTVENLWDEIINGETYLQDNPPLRIIQVVQVFIRRGNLILIEAEQEFGHGGTRSRNLPPSEKIKPGETYLEAAIRCLQEELGAVPQDITVDPSTYRQTQTIKDSPSYPGLATEYVLHMVEARVKGLPRTDFWTTNAAYTSGDPISRQHWVWQPEEAGPD